MNSQGYLYLINDSSRAMLNYHQELGNVFINGIDNPDCFA